MGGNLKKSYSLDPESKKKNKGKEEKMGKMRVVWNNPLTKYAISISDYYVNFSIESPHYKVSNNYIQISLEKEGFIHLGMIGKIPAIILFIHPDLIEFDGNWHLRNPAKGRIIELKPLPRFEIDIWDWTCPGFGYKIYSDKLRNKTKFLKLVPDPDVITWILETNTDNRTLDFRLITPVKILYKFSWNRFHRGLLVCDTEKSLVVERETDGIIRDKVCIY